MQLAAPLERLIGELRLVCREQYGPADRNNSFRGLSISYALQPIPAGRAKPLGTADALLCALRSREDWRGRSFTVCNSDNLYSVDALRRLLDDGHRNALIDYDQFCGVACEKPGVGLGQLQTKGPSPRDEQVRPLV